MTDVMTDDPFDLSLTDNVAVVEYPAPAAKGELEVSDAAKAKIADVLANKIDQSFLRVRVRGGGCSGYQVSFVIDDALGSDDILLKDGGSRMVIDAVALSIVGHAIVEYQEDFSGSFFHLVVPKSVAQCGCGESFAL